MGDNDYTMNPDVASETDVGVMLGDSPLPLSVTDPVNDFYCDAFPMVKVDVKTLTGKNFAVAGVFPHLETVLDLKLVVQNGSGIPVDQQRLIALGKQMEDDRTLSYYKISMDTTIHLVLRLRGVARTKQSWKLRRAEHLRRESKGETEKSKVRHVGPSAFVFLVDRSVCVRRAKLNILWTKIGK